MKVKSKKGSPQVMALLALGFLCGTCQATMQRDIVYKSVEGQDIALDVCTPDNSGDHPVAILVHGGGWGSGDKSGADKPNSGADISPWFDAFTEAGFTWFSINYRLAPASRWPACLEDTIDAIDWVQHHAADYGGDPQRIVIVGHSAGGQLAVLAALRLPDPTGLQGVIGCAAVTSFEQDLEIRGGVSKALQDLFDQPKEPNDVSLKLLHDHSPIHNIPAQTSLPAFLLMHGDADKTVPLQQSLDFRNQLLLRASVCDLKILPNAPHRLTEWDQYDPAWGKKMTAWALDTVNRAKSEKFLQSLQPIRTDSGVFLLPEELMRKPHERSGETLNLRSTYGYNLLFAYDREQLKEIRVISKKPLHAEFRLGEHQVALDLPVGTEVCLDDTLRERSSRHIFDACVAKDGSAEYTTVSDAVRKAPQRKGENDRWIIHVEPGIYHETLYLQREKRYLTLQGEDPRTTLISYHLNAHHLGADGQPIGTFKTASVVVDADDFRAENLTIENSAGPTGQALAIRLDGDRAVFKNCRFLGWQDTILSNRGRHYFKNCTITGQTDFIFGAGTCLFEDCTIHCLKSSYITAASTPEDTPYGYVFSRCAITGETPLVQTYLGRPWRDHASVAFLNCRMEAIIRPEGWHNWGQPIREQTSRYLEGGNSGPGAVTSMRVNWAKQWTPSETDAFAPATILLGNDQWNPTLP